MTDLEIRLADARNVYAGATRKAARVWGLLVGLSNKRVYLFREGDKSQRDLLGGKGANLAEMTNIGLPVPPGFTVTTQV